jgi:hypothetical protein
VRERVLLIAPHAHDRLPRHIHNDPADRGADPAEAPHGSNFALRADRGGMEVLYDLDRV